ncbi:MAG: hypothetical protein HKN72_11440 [Gemmatimonadetes bacterium]|nr:hypothetical protein [Gemmatimonadota bacterium]NNF13832.1 hypothetical protein [Gemmatimonadota bacterium]NNK64112.1 hypothetical protein [Gemmatimonadota bacterium]NNL29465.1 hypothetical protein [Gemmatimonadota bacterium]
MIEQNLLDILVCPETKQPLRVVDAGVLSELNASIEAGAVTNRGGETLSTPLVEALVREDGTALYPVRDDIPIMLIDESIPLPTKQDATTSHS